VFSVQEEVLSITNIDSLRQRTRSLIEPKSAVSRTNRDESLGTTSEDCGELLAMGILDALSRDLANLRTGTTPKPDALRAIDACFLEEDGFLLPFSEIRFKAREER
jgi:hypothetical protein